MSEIATQNNKLECSLHILSLLCYSCLVMGMTIDPGVIDYLAGVTGETPWIEPMPDQIVSTLPLYLRQRYEFFRTDLFGRQCVLARENSPTKNCRRRNTDTRWRS